MASSETAAPRPAKPPTVRKEDDAMHTMMRAWLVEFEEWLLTVEPKKPAARRGGAGSSGDTEPHTHETARDAVIAVCLLLGDVALINLWLSNLNAIARLSWSVPHIIAFLRDVAGGNGSAKKSASASAAGRNGGAKKSASTSATGGNGGASR